MSDTAIIAITSSITSIIAIVVPLATTIYTLHHNKQMKAIELYYENKVTAYKDFFDAYGKYIAIKNFNCLQTLGEYTSKAVMFASEEVRSKLLVILDYANKVIETDAPPTKALTEVYNEVVPLIVNDLNLIEPKFSRKLLHRLSKYKASK